MVSFIDTIELCRVANLTTTNTNLFVCTDLTSYIVRYVLNLCAMGQAVVSRSQTWQQIVTKPQRPCLLVSFCYLTIIGIHLSFRQCKHAPQAASSLSVVETRLHHPFFPNFGGKPCPHVRLSDCDLKFIRACVCP